MTQQQIGFMNAQISKERLALDKTSAEAAMLQARTAKRRQEFEESTKYWTDVATGAIATAAGIIALALI